MSVKEGRRERHAGRGGQRQVTVPRQATAPEQERIPEQEGIPEPEREPEPELEPEAVRDRPAVPAGAILEGAVVPAPRRAARQRGRGLAVAWVAVAVAVRAARDTRFQATVITGVITVIAMSKISKANFLGTMQHLSAWDARALRETEERWRRRAAKA
jgi:hypothetical protein